MAARSPEEIDGIFERELNAANVEGLLALYEPGAAFTVEPGKVVTGTAAISTASRPQRAVLFSGSRRRRARNTRRAVKRSAPSCDWPERSAIRATLPEISLTHCDAAN